MKNLQKDLLVAAALSALSIVILQLSVVPHDAPWKALSYWANATPQLLILNFVAVTTLYLLLSRILPFFIVGGMGLTLSTMFSIGNAIKIQQTQTPILPHDLLMVENVQLLSTYLPLQLRISAGIFFMSAIGALAFWIIQRKKRGDVRIRKTWKERAAFSLITLPGILLALALFAGVYISYPSERGNRAIQNMAWAQVENAQTNGVPLTWLMNLRLQISPPAAYSAELVHQILSDYEAPINSSPSAQLRRTTKMPKSGKPAAEIKPDILILMVESWMDPSRIPNLKLNRDPMAKVRAYMESDHGGEVIVPVFGGMTANSEFEMLTGVPTAFLPDSAVVYQNYLRAPLQALPNILRERGYDSFAIHNYEPWFWHRDTVYPNLGFKRFFSVYDLGPLNPRDWRPEDKLLEPKIQELLADTPGRGPRFVFAVTMEMHGNYEYKPFRENMIQASAPWMTASDKKHLENYTSALEASSETLASLIAYVKKRKRPTILMAFGDHMPGLNDVYHRAGMIQHEEKSSWSPVERRRMYRTPYVMVSNYPLKGDLPKEIGAHCLGETLTEIAGFTPNDPYFRFLSSACHEHPDLMRGDLDMSNPLHRDYGMLAYDRLFGVRASFSPELNTPNPH